VDFELTEEQRMLRQELRTFLRDKCPKEYVRQLDRRGEFPHDLWKEMGKLGWLALPFEEKYGGINANILDIQLVVEELSYAWSVLGYSYDICPWLVATTVGTFGNEEQKDFYLPMVAKGEIRFANSITEPNAGTDLLALTTSARRDGDDYILNGQKIFTSGGYLADYLIVTARTEKVTERRSQGMSNFIVSTKTPGVTVNRLDCLGMRSLSLSEVFFDDARVSGENLLGEKNNGWIQIHNFLGGEGLIFSTLPLGAAQAAFEEILLYVQERHAFNRPIGQFQAIQHRLADMAASIELARNTLYKAAWLHSVGRPDAVVSGAAGMAATNTYTQVTTQGMGIFGGYSFIKDSDIQRHLRDSAAWMALSGTMGKTLMGRALGLPKSY